MMKFLFVFQLLLINIFSFSQSTTCFLKDEKAGARSRNFDTQHLLLEVSFEPEKGLVKGKVTHTFVPLQKQIDSLFLDAPGIKIQKVTLDKKEVVFTTNNEGIVIRPPKSLQWDKKHDLTIEYEAQPRKGIYFIGWKNENSAKPNRDLFATRNQIWTQGQGVDNRHWIPMHDDMFDKMTTEVKVTFDKNYRVLSNGELISEKEVKGGNKLWHYKMQHPHAPYLIMLGIGNYDVKTEKSKSGVNIQHWYYPEFPERVEPTYRYTVEMMNWMEKEFGVPYPWGKTYANLPVQNFIYGAMENTTATIFGDFYFVNDSAFLDRDYVGTNAHELAHQWFGDYITARGSEDTWLQESFATHYQKHFERNVFGEDYFQWNRRQELERVLSAAKRDNNPIVNTSAGSERVYPKGSLVLDMLKYILGTEQYNRAQTYYLKKHAFGHVDTHDFYIAFLETLGMNLDWFFHQWLYRGGEPHYKVTHEELTTSAGKKITRFNVAQTQETNDLVGLFKMPIKFEVHYTDGTFDTSKVWIGEKFQTVDVANEKMKTVDYVLFDPNYEIIKQVDFPRPVAMLKAQAQKAKNMIDRYDALRAISKENFPDKKTFLLQGYGRENFYAMRVEIVNQLMNLQEESSNEEIATFLKDKNSEVRETAVRNLQPIPAELQTNVEALLKDSSYNVIETTLKILSKDFPEKIRQYLAATENVQGMGNNVRIARLEIGARIDSAKYLPQLVELASADYEFGTRSKAFDALKRLDHLDEKVIENLFDATFSINRRLAGPAKSLLKHFMTSTHNRERIEKYYFEKDYEAWQTELVRDLF